MDSDSSFSQQQPVSKRKKSSLLVVAGSLGFVGALFWPFLRHGLRRTAPYVAASDSLVAKQVEAAKLLWKTDEAVMCDLGSGDGELVLAFASAFPQAKCIGVENNPWLTWLSRYRAAARRLKNASFQTGDLYKLPISNCNMVLACLVSDMLPQLEAKLLREAKPGTIVMCARFPLPTMGKYLIHESAGGPVDGLWCYQIQNRH